MSHLRTIRYSIVISILFIFIVCAGVISCNLTDSSPDLIWTMVKVNTSSQGDAHVIEVKRGKTILIDAGLRNIAQKQLIPFLEGNNIRHFDIVFISHPHKDHYQGILPILKAGIRINDIYFNIPNKEICDREIPWGCQYKDILAYHQLLKDYDVKIHLAKAGQTFDLGNGATIKILYAFDGINTPVGRTDINDLSLIMMLEQSGYKMLFTGDLNKKIGKYLASHAHDIQADILKVPHHGTEGCAPDSFFQAVNPKYALVPAPGRLWCSKRSSRIRSWFEKNEIPVFVNGFHGNVRVEIRKGRLQLRPIQIIPEKEVPALCQ
jgi:competence protein ComEC